MKPLGQATDPVTPDFHLTVFLDDQALVIKTQRDSTGTHGTRRYPLGTGKWVHDAITRHFWADPPPTQLTLTHDQLELRRSWGLGGPDGKGFTLTNFAELTPSGVPQELALTDELLLEGGLLALLLLDVLPHVEPVEDAPDEPGPPSNPPGLAL